MKPAKDRTPPAPATVLRLAANDAHSISLTWTNPRDADFVGVLIRRSNDGSPPSSAEDGVLVAALNARQATFTDRRLTAGHHYSYAVFARDKARNVGVPVTLSTATRSGDAATGVRGKVTDQQGRAIKGVGVEIRAAETGIAYAAGTVTSSTGQFLATGLIAGTYYVCFMVTSDTSGHSVTGYRSACYRQQLYTPVEVRTGKITSGLVDYLHVAGAISGRVTDSAGRGIPHVSVATYGTDSENNRHAVTGPDGAYTVTGLEADYHSVCFTSQDATGASPTGYLDECYDNQPPYSPYGTPVSVTLGQTSSGIDAVMDVAGAITGRVTDGNGVPVANVKVSIGGSYENTDSTGAYTIKGVATGTPFICFDGSHLISAEAPYGYTNTCDGSTGVWVDVTAGETTTLDGRVDVAGAIGGTVRGDDGPLAGVVVRVTNSPWTVDRSAVTDENGSYLVAGLPPGEVTACVEPTYSSGYLQACYGGDETGSATPVLISSGQLGTADIQLHRGASITGTVTDASGAPIAGVVVTTDQMYSASTDESGNYTIGGLPAGNYRICFDTLYARGPSASGYAAECYDNQPSPETADPVAVGTSASVTVDASLSPGAAITGHVTDAAGHGIPSVWVEVSRADGGYLSFDYTDENGRYAITGLPATAVQLCFTPPDGTYLSECYDNQPDASTANPITVSSGVVSSGVDAVLADAPSAATAPQAH